MACRDEMLQWGRSRLAPENVIAGRAGHAAQVASMGPEPVSSGKRNKAAPDPLLPLASMGPEPVSSGKLRIGTADTIFQLSASMGPEPVSSGKPRAATCHPLGA